MTTSGTDLMFIESTMPTFDTTIAEHLVVAADPTTTFQAARTLDLLTVRTPLLMASMWLRGLPARWFGRAAPLPRLVVAEAGLPGWLLIGEQPNREIAFAAVGKFWQPIIEWRDVPLAGFAGFAEPGWARLQRTSRWRLTGSAPRCSATNAAP